MKIRELLAYVREVKPNQYSDEVMLRWLSELDGQLYVDVVQNAQDAPPPPRLPYRADRDMERELLAAHPHDGLYAHYLAAQIDYNNGEFDRYNNGMVMYNVAHQGFVDAYTRNHMPKEAVIYV